MNANVNLLSDRVLLNNYLSGDRSAKSELLERHSQRVRSYIAMMVKDDDIADDIFQETFIKAVKVIDEGRYTDSGKFLSWVLRIAHNRVLDHFRREKHNRTINEKEAGYDMFSTIKLSEGSVEDSMVMSEMQATIRSLVAATAGKTAIRRTRCNCPRCQGCKAKESRLERTVGKSNGGH